MSEVEQKNCCPVVISKDQIIPGTEFYDMWNVGSAPDYKAQVPIFSVYNMHGLNAIIGYVMLMITQKRRRVLKNWRERSADLSTPSTASTRRRSWMASGL